MISNFILSIIRFRAWVISLTLLITLLAGFYATQLHIIIDPVAILPASHPFVSFKALLQNTFNEYDALVIAR